MSLKEANSHEQEIKKNSHKTSIVGEITPWEASNWVVNIRYRDTTWPKRLRPISLDLAMLY